eukprot:TRINITY_DN15425_c0_g1_i6.p1 TRINITY_DN15425_c0_g1~~TRINITY_DN15425_c0_g1_i6.p1  ORF type:complete len:332 (+),score=84.85 TRINITY_DN15425_c0_g1_i6:95-997(+)
MLRSLVGSEMCIRDRYMTLNHAPTTPHQDRTKGGMGHLQEVIQKSVKMVVPAVIYLIMNLISYPALARIDASTFTAISQLKILSTAFMSVQMLGTTVSIRKWRTLLLMVCGVVIVSVGSAPASKPGSNVLLFDYMVGVLCASVQTVLSGFAAVYFEKVLKTQQKGETFNVWDRNIQLAVISIIIYLPMGASETSMDLFSGFSPLIWFICFLHAAGGILVALSVLYSDSIAKTVAVCGGLVLTTVLGYYMFDAPMDLNILAGCLVTVLSILGYKDDCQVDQDYELLTKYQEEQEEIKQNGV